METWFEPVFKTHDDFVFYGMEEMDLKGIRVRIDGIEGLVMCVNDPFEELSYVLSSDMETPDVFGTESEIIEQAEHYGFYAICIHLDPLRRKV